MATAQVDDVALSVRVGRQKLSLYVKRKDTIGYVVKKATAQLKEPEEKKYMLLYKGSVVSEELKVGDALAREPVTVVHLAPRMEDHMGRPCTGEQTRADINNNPTAKMYGFCKECNMLCGLRPVFKCKSCRQEGTFARKVPVPVDFHADDIPDQQLEGFCNTKTCRDQLVLPIVTYQCKACEEYHIAFLRQIRENVNLKPCMKCTKACPTVFLFTCSSGHTMCLQCFILYCRTQFEVGNFRQFEMLGFTIPCPGPGEDCPMAGVPDPHHFRLVDKDGEFYSDYKDKAAFGYVPPGKNILCECKSEIVVPEKTKSPPEPLTEPQQQSSIGGGIWFLKLFRRQPPPPPPPPPSQPRRKIPCQECSRVYCCECKQYWHDGQCIPVSKELEDIAKKFPIDRRSADASRWS